MQIKDKDILLRQEKHQFYLHLLEGNIQLLESLVPNMEKLQLVEWQIKHQELFLKVESIYLP